MRWLTLCVLAGCLQPNQVVCDDGRICPGGTACDPTHSLCVAPDQLKVCAGADPGIPCTIDSTDDGLCDQGVCIAKHCGDGYRRDNEQCDGTDVPDDANCNKIGFYFDGKPTCNDACSYDTSSCKGYCGDGEVTPGIEVCDNGTAIEGSCVDFGFGAGNLGCAACVADTNPCIPFGWKLEDVAGFPGDIEGTAADDIWMLTFDSTYQQASLNHFDGTSWTPVDLSGCALAGDESLYAMSTPSKGVLFIAGTTTILRLMGSTCTKWTGITSGTNGIWAAGPNDARVLSGEGVTHFDGATWSLELTTIGGGPDPGFATALGGTSATDVYVAISPTSGSPYLRHYDGTWSSPIDPGLTAQSFGPIWSTSSNDVYVAGGGKINRWNGVSWSTFLDSPLFATGYSSISRGLKTPDGKTYLLASNSSSAGFRRYFLINDGTGWSQMVRQLAATGTFWATSNGVVMQTRSGSKQLATFDGSDRIDTIPGLGVSNAKVFVAAHPDDAYASDFGSYSFYHWDGASWQTDTTVTEPNDVAFTPDGTAVSVSFTSGVWLKPPAGSWTNYTNGTHGYKVSALAADDLWIAGINKIVHWQSGSTSTDIAHTGKFMVMNGIYAASDSDVFAVGYDFNAPDPAAAAMIVHYNGATLSDMTLPAGAPNLEQVWGRSGTDVYAIGGGVMLHFDGTSWTIVDVGEPVHAAWGSPNDLFVTTASGIEHFDGTTWSPVDTGTSQIGYSAITGVGNWIYALDAVGGFHQLLRLKPW